MGIWYLVSVLTHLSLQKEIPQSWGPGLPGYPEAATILEATINCIQREMISNEHLRANWCVAHKVVYEDHAVTQVDTV